MDFRKKENIISLIQTLFILGFINLFVSSLFHFFGHNSFENPLHILIILYFSIKFDSTERPFIILLVELLQGAFSVEGWAYGTFTGVILSILLLPFKGFLHFSNYFVMFLVSFFFQVSWFIFSTGLLTLRLSQNHFSYSKFSDAVAVSLLFSLMTPPFLKFMDKVWSTENQEQKAIV